MPDSWCHETRSARSPPAPTTRPRAVLTVAVAFAALIWLIRDLDTTREGTLEGPFSTREEADRAAGKVRSAGLRPTITAVSAAGGLGVIELGVDRKTGQVVTSSSRLVRNDENFRSLVESSSDGVAIVSTGGERLAARVEPVEWPVAEYGLVASAAGRYETLASWRLG